MGAVSAQALALRCGIGPASARARLAAGERAGLLARWRILAGEPALYTVTPAGLRASGLHGLDRCRVSAANARHLGVCAQVAAALEWRYPEQRVLGERELRRDEQLAGRALASASLGMSAEGRTLLHRPDLVLWPRPPAAGLPVAVEVELTVKAPARLAGILLAWARCRCVAGVLYLAAPQVLPAVERAHARSQAGERVVVLELSSALDGGL